MARFSGSVCLVTGGAGFIGSHLVDGLLRQGAKVRVGDNLSTGYETNLAQCMSSIEFLKGDLAEVEVCRKAISGVDYVFHLAAIPSVPRSIDNPDESNRSNVTATLNLAAASNRANVKRFVFSSTCAIYGDAQSIPISETEREHPLSPYALSKLMGEQYLDMCRRVYGLEAVCLRYFNVFGPRQDPNSPYSGVISRFLTAMHSGNRPVVFGDGKQTRDFVFVEDVVHANLLACHAEGAPGQVINIGTGNGVTLLDLLRVLAEITGAKTAAEHQAPRAGDVRHSQADIGRARTLLGFSPNVPFEDGLRRTADALKKL
jgi:UDP-glucose 4-epimerase